MRTANDLVNAARERIKEIQVEHFAALSEARPLLIDVREPNEFAESHVRGAINLPRGLLEFKILSHPELAGSSAEEPASQAARPIVVYCQTGGRAALAADSLQQLGFSKVQSLAGGITAWKEAGFPVVTD